METPNSERVIDVADHPMAWRWMKELAKRDPYSFARLVENNTQRFQTYFGPPTWVTPDGHSKMYGWAKRVNGLQWIIVSGDQGTQFRVQTPALREEFIHDKRIGLGLTQALQEWLDMLLGQKL